MQIITERLEELASISLAFGAHTSPEDGLCALEAVAWISGEPHSDHPECACPVITAFMVSWNDGLPSDEERDRLLKPLIPRIVGTRGSKALEKRRVLMAADWLIRTHTSAWLRLAGLTAQADALAALPEITDMVKVPPIQPTLDAIRKDAAAARAAAWDAAWDAAGAAARDAAWAAARDAARDAAWAAARATARAAARATAWATAWDAAWNAAWDAARAAAGDAAWAAAGDALKPTKSELQASAFALVVRMVEASDV